MWAHRIALLAVALAVLLADHAGAQQQQLGQGAAVYTPLPPGTLNTVRRQPVLLPTARPARPAGGTVSTSSTKQAAPPANPTSMSSTGSNMCASASSSPWALSAISAAASGLPTQTERVLICIISSGVAVSSPYLKHVSWSGCAAQDPLDPGGCVLNWASPMDNGGNWKQRGTNAAHLIAAKAGLDPKVAGVISDKTDIYVVPVNPDTGSLEPGSTAAGGTSRIRAYSVCEGRLRGLQAQDVGSYTPLPAAWRMVVLVDVAAASPAAPIGSSSFRISEADWFKTATGQTAEGRPPDVLVVAPAGDGSSIAYPAALPQVLAVGGYNCEGKPLKAYSAAPGTSKAQPDILAPGKNIYVPDVRKDGFIEPAKLWEGSAAAAAYVAAGAARLWTAYPTCSADVIKQALLSSKAAQGTPAMLNLQQAHTFLSQQKC